MLKCVSVPSSANSPYTKTKLNREKVGYELIDNKAGTKGLQFKRPVLVTSRDGKEKARGLWGGCNLQCMVVNRDQNGEKGTITARIH